MDRLPIHLAVDRFHFDAELMDVVDVKVDDSLEFLKETIANQADSESEIFTLTRTASRIEKRRN